MNTRADFPPEDQIPFNRKSIRELLDGARTAKLSDRYIRVLRHRLMDAVVRELEEGTL